MWHSEAMVVSARSMVVRRMCVWVVMVCVVCILSVRRSSVSVGCRVLVLIVCMVMGVVVVGVWCCSVV